MPCVVKHFCPGTCTDTLGFICSGTPDPRKFRLSTEKKGQHCQLEKDSRPRFTTTWYASPLTLKRRRRYQKQWSLSARKLASCPCEYLYKKKSTWTDSSAELGLLGEHATRSTSGHAEKCLELYSEFASRSVEDFNVDGNVLHE